MAGRFQRKIWRKMMFRHPETHPQSLRKNQKQQRQKKWCRVNTVFIFTSRGTTNAKYARESRLQGVLAGNALARPYLEQKVLVTWSRQITKFSVNVVSFATPHRYAVVVQDLATQWIEAYPCRMKTAQETERSLRKFLEPSEKPKVIYTDNS